MVFNREKGIRKRMKALMGQNSELEQSDLEIAESFAKGLCNSLEIDIDKINKKYLRDWLIDFVKVFVLPVQHAQLIKPTHKELYHYGHLLGQQLAEPIILSLQEGNLIESKVEAKKNGIFKGGLRTRLQEKIQQPQVQEIDDTAQKDTRISETEALFRKHIQSPDYKPDPKKYIETEEKDEEIDYDDYVEDEEDDEYKSFSLEI